MRKRLTKAKIDIAVQAVTAACGAAQVVFETDGRIRVIPAAPEASNAPVDYKGEIRL
jgi:hypothetical protein